MADNVAFTPGSGATFATDDIGGVHHQKVKLEFGIADAATLVSANDPLPVTAPAAARTTHSIAAALQTGVIMLGLTELTVKFFSVTVAQSQTDAQLIAAVANKILRVVAIVVHCAGTATASTFESGGTTRIHKTPAGIYGGEVLPPNPWGWFQTASGAALTVSTGAGSDTEYTGSYIEV